MNKSLTAERSNLESELEAFKDKINVSHKELKDVNTQRKKTMEEFSDLNDKLAEIRSQKLKLTRLVREKEEEIGTVIWVFLTINVAFSLYTFFGDNGRERHFLLFFVLFF